MLDATLILKEDATKQYRLDGDGELSIYENVSEEEYLNYQSRLKACEKVKLYCENAIGKHLSHSYLGEDLFLHTWFTPRSGGTVRVVAKPKKAKFNTVLPLEEEPHEPVCKPTFAVMSLDYSAQNVIDANGMSYVFRLEDGSFIIYDGGYLNDAKRLFSYLSDHTPFSDGRIIISAWIMTHSHSDHYSCFLGFSRMYADKVEVKHFVLNAPLPDPEIINLARHNDFLNVNFFEYVGKYKNADVLQVHTGQKLRFAGLELEVLQTYEDILPLKIDWLNEASLVTRIQLCGQTFLFPADAELKGDRALERYGKYLKSDFLQVTHHGFSGGTLPLMDMIDPKYVMWTTNFECYTQRTVRTWHRNGVNRYLLNCKSVDYSFVADGLCKILKLPFSDLKEVQYYNYPQD